MMKKQQSSQFSRRNLLKVGAGAIGTGLLVTQLPIQPQIAQAEPDKSKFTPEQALNELMAGNQRFVKEKRQKPNQNVQRVKAVAQGQSPFAAILGCADSRVPLEIVFDQGIGDLFVVRIAGNIAGTEEIASQEFGTLVLGAKVLMILGHERCGAVQAALDGKSLPGSLNSLVSAIRPAVNNSKGQSGDPLDNAIKENVKVQVANLKKSPIISDLVKEGKLKVVGGYYDLDTGEISLIS